ncbi:MAG: hypothetical protein ACOZCO_17185 [Bacteroidota bacterium]
MKKYISISLFILLAVVFSCKKNKDNTIVIEGTVTLENSGGPASGVTVKLQYQEVNNNTFSNVYRTAATATTDASGRYSMSFENPSALNYKWVLSSDSYFGFETSQDPSLISVSETNTKNFTISPVAYFSMRIKNDFMTSSTDSVTYQNTSEAYGCSTCCNNAIFTYTGAVLDTTFVCKRKGGTEIKFSWFVTLGSTTMPYSDSLTCVPFDTTFYTITY